MGVSSQPSITNSDAFTRGDRREFRGAGFGDDPKLQHRVPVAAGPATKAFLDHRVRQLGAALSVRIENVGLLALRLYDLRARDGCLERGDVFGFGRALQKENYQVPWIPLGFLAKRILPDHALPLLGSAHKKINFERESVRGFRLQKALELGARSHFARENEIPALEERSGILEPDLRYEIAQISHPDLPVSADVDAAEQCDMSCQREPSAVIDTQTT